MSGHVNGGRTDCKGGPCSSDGERDLNGNGGDCVSLGSDGECDLDLMAETLGDGERDLMMMGELGLTNARAAAMAASSVTSALLRRATTMSNSPSNVGFEIDHSKRQVGQRESCAVVLSKQAL